jgi:hypothetical protein
MVVPMHAVGLLPEPEGVRLTYSHISEVTRKEWVRVVANTIYELDDPGLAMPEGMEGDDAKKWLCQYLAIKAVTAIADHETVEAELARLKLVGTGAVNDDPLKAFEGLDDE